MKWISRQTIHADERRRMNKRRKILIVDDEPSTLRLLSAMLRRENVNVEQASSMTAALESIKNVLPDIVMTDVLMPDGSGLELQSVFLKIHRPHL